MKRPTVYRWQDVDGRGPYKPGLSDFWAEPSHYDRNPAIFYEFPKWIASYRDPALTYGCAFRTVAQMHAWFTPAEIERMLDMGYQFGRMEVDRIECESERQLVFARRRPLKFGLEVIELPRFKPAAAIHKTPEGPRLVVIQAADLYPSPAPAGQPTP